MNRLRVDFVLATSDRVLRLSKIFELDPLQSAANLDAVFAFAGRTIAEEFFLTYSHEVRTNEQTA